MEFRRWVWLENVSACGVVCCCCQARGPADSSVGVSRLTYGSGDVFGYRPEVERGERDAWAEIGCAIEQIRRERVSRETRSEAVRIGSRSSGGNDGSLTSSLRFQVSGCGPVSGVGLLLAERGKLRRSIRQAQAGWQERDRRSARRARSTVCTEGIGRGCVRVCLCIVFGKRGTLRTAAGGGGGDGGGSSSELEWATRGGREGKEGERAEGRSDEEEGADRGG